MNGKARVLRLAAACAGIAALGLTAATANAGIVGPCSASIAGQGVGTAGTGATDGAIAVANNAAVPVVMTAGGALDRVRITLGFAGFSWTVKDSAVGGQVYRGTVPVKDYALYGVGLYKVSGIASGVGVHCTGSALVRVKGEALATVAGGVGIGAAALGALGLLAGLAGGAGGVTPFRVGRSSVAGLLAGFGAVVLLQQLALLYPTALVAAVGLAAGFGAGTAAPWLGKLLLHARAAGHGGMVPPRALPH